MEERIDFDFMLWQLLHRTFRAVDKVRERELEQWGLTTGKSAVLRVILRLGKEAAAKEISRQLVLEKKQHFRTAKKNGKRRPNKEGERPE